MVKSCWICKTAGNKSKKSYFRVPKFLRHRNGQISRLSALRKDKWHKILLLPEDSSGIRVCSDHFLSGNPARLLDVDDPDWVPTQNLTGKDTEKGNLENLQTQEMIVKEKEGEKSVTGSKEAMCRFCMRTTAEDSSSDIFNTSDEKLGKMISIVMGHSIRQDETLPRRACHPCLRKMRLCLKLINFFRRNERCLVKKYSSAPYEGNNSEGSIEKILNRSPPSGKGVTRTRRSRRDNSSTAGDRERGKCGARESADEAVDAARSEETTHPRGREYDEEQIRFIIENDSCGSEEDVVESGSLAKVRKRKYDVQNVEIRPVEVKTLKCNNCYEKFDAVNDLRLHKNFCRLFYCQLCKPRIAFADKREQVTHRKRCHSEALACHVCGKLYSQWYLPKHFKNHFERERRCSFCGKIFKNVTTLMTHVDNFHSRRRSSLCDRCGDSFADLKAHANACGESNSKAA